MKTLALTFYVISCLYKQGLYIVIDYNLLKIML